MQKALQTDQLPSTFWKWFKQRKNPTRQVLVFVPTIKLAARLIPPLQERLPEQKITAVHAADKDREEKVQQFRNKEYDLLVTTTILERGVTFPSVDVAVLDAGHHVFDQAALVQIAGRAGRSPLDPTGEVIFFHDGKTDAMMEAGQAIYQMNQKARK
ncbi:hypothetical protein GCM10011351_21980 [Paraliobacillus quinghaiensis]|uniref:Helicase C-terminal domain-containing protein n=1 Tax=Paraliobacillus quinghaiensis TaxID=470815 RepID=A0A917WWW6_9BACI|nr:helicase-related protein [Paraliobacillus quinghaiensis]GGM35474.1 hypothetical protein GCM10011351_21980 [Paraliobacillus quinghaiensis]